MTKSEYKTKQAERDELINKVERHSLRKKLISTFRTGITKELLKKIERHLNGEHIQQMPKGHHAVQIMGYDNHAVQIMGYDNQTEIFIGGFSFYRCRTVHLAKFINWNKEINRISGDMKALYKENAKSKNG